MPTDFHLTESDRCLLQKQRLDRFRAFFPNPLASSLLLLRTPHQLTIHCSEAWMVDDLLSEVDRLRDRSWLVLGVRQIVICFAEEEIYSTPTRCLVEIG